MSITNSHRDSFLKVWSSWKNQRKMAEKLMRTPGSGDTSTSLSKNASTESINDKEYFINRFKNLYNNQMFSDVILKVGDITYYAHKIMLVTASEVFEAMLSEDRWKEATESVVSLTEEECCVPVFDMFLKYLYCGSVEVNTETVLPVLLLADKYGIKRLCDSCVDYMMQHIVESPDSNRTLSWYQYAKMTGNQVLQEKCQAFILSHFSIVQKASDWMAVSVNELTEFLSSSEIVVTSEYELWQEVERWLLCKHNRDHLVENLKGVMPLIRFSLMTPCQLSLVEESPLYHEYKDIFGDKIWSAYRRHSLMYEDIIASREPYRNYNCKNQYAVYCDLTLKKYTSKQKVDSKITVENLKIPANFMPVPLQSQSKQFTFLVDFFPMGFFIPHVLYAQYIGRHNDDTTLKIRRCNPSTPTQQSTPLPDMRAEITLIIYGMKGTIRYAAHTFRAKHTFSAEASKFEVPSIIHISKLKEAKSNYLVNGDFEARLFLKIQEIIDKKS
ncbi:BTB/POZ domain-containing protein 17-like isoform X1 [Mytilus galloprovincialis]|uniref:BTB/POZ domain-containing protein 17-like isoform X1 n=2 Tax=Mytilus galloprovincialis TaxID=29158 RepID=UPI003F7BDB9F